MIFTLDVTLARHPERTPEEIADAILGYLCKEEEDDLLDVVSYDGCEPVVVVDHPLA